MGKLLGLIVGIIMLIVVVAIGPLLAIWAWNTLFGFAHVIPYTLDTWVAVVIVGVFLRSNIKITKKD